MKKYNKGWFVSNDYLHAIWFVEESKFTWYFRLKNLIVIYSNQNLYYSIKDVSTKSEFYCCPNYKNIEDKLAQIIYKTT